MRMHNRVRITLSLLVAVAVLSGGAPAFAEQPFVNYQPYGSWRGRIRTVDGVFRNKQRIKWGNGITETGAAVLHDAFIAAGQILPVVLGGKDAEGPQEKDAISPEERAAALGVDTELQGRADTLLAANRKLAEKFGVKLDAAPATGGPTPATGNGNKPADDFKDWDNTPNPPKPAGH